MSSAFFVSVVVVIIVVCSAMSSYADQSQTQFEEFLLTLERNETESAAANPHRHHHQTQSNAVTAVHSVDGVGVTRSDSPDGDSVSTSASTKEDGDEDEDGPLNGQTSNELLSYFKYVPRTHWSCCMLGLLAGNKGFQCRAEFYSSSMTLRNFNRPGRHSGGGPRDRTRGYEIMRTFRRCVTNDAHEFHRCCHVAVTERQELSVARSYRRNRSGST